MGLIFFIILLLLLFGAVPVWPYSRSWGYGPSGIVGLLLAVLLILMLFEMMPWGFGPAVPVAPTPAIPVR